jgi:hypothetical protein
MPVVETIAEASFFGQRKPIKAICRRFRVSPEVVGKVIRSQATEFRMSAGVNRCRGSRPKRALQQLVQSPYLALSLTPCEPSKHGADQAGLQAQQ